MAKKVCKKCRMFVEGNVCPVCKSNQFSESWKGRLAIIDPEKSEIASKLKFSKKGNFAIKTR